MPLHRPRRNRKSPQLRSLVQECHLHCSDLIYPLFVVEGEKKREKIASLPEVERYSLDILLGEIEKICALNIPAVALFPVIPSERKDFLGEEALNPKGLICRALAEIKARFPHLCLISDVALDPYTTHGHDGLLDAHGEVVNDSSVEVLAKMALLHAQCGADMVAPSDMMDGRVHAIRTALDQEGFTQTNIHTYCAKYASAFYGPFRDALASAPKKGDKKSYQMNPANRREALLEAALDEREGADILMVKPAIHYLDVIAELRAHTHLPISAYHVSGEYAMLLAAAERGWIEKEAALWEAVLSIKRAGADMIFTYAAPKIAEMITTGALD